ncbi:MAG: hypothetical protein RID91_04285 [Azospirillaceae bacterium]
MSGEIPGLLDLLADRRDRWTQKVSDAEAGRLRGFGDREADTMRRTGMADCREAIFVLQKDA